MQPENETPTEPIQAQSQKDQLLSQAATPETHKPSKAPWAVAAVASVVALAGIAFGIYSFMDGNNKSDEIANLKSKISTLQTSIDKNDENEQNEGNEDKVNDSVVVYSTLKDTETIHFTQSLKGRSFPESASTGLWMFASTSNGELSCEVREYAEGEYENRNSGKKYADCDLSAHKGKVVDIVGGFMGNGGDYLILILNTEGDVEYLNESGQEYAKLKKLDLPKKVVRIYGDSKVSGASKEASEQEAMYGAGVEVVVQYTDGTTEGLFSYFNSGHINS